MLTLPLGQLRLPRRCGWTKLSPVFELVSPSGREQQQGLGPGTQLSVAQRGVPPPRLSQKKIHLQQHMSILKVGCVLLKRALVSWDR